VLLNKAIFDVTAPGSCWFTNCSIDSSSQYIFVRINATFHFNIKIVINSQNENLKLTDHISTMRYSKIICETFY
jgi:hypothetical protein